MKKETLGRRIAEKSGTPVLEGLVLGKVSASDLPDNCIPWAGKCSGAKGRRLRKRRDYDFLQYQIPTYDHPRPVIRFNKQERGVHQILFESLFDLDYPYRLEKACGSQVCINPLHYEPKQIFPRECVPFFDEESENPGSVISEEWSDEDVAEVIELALIENTPGNWAELMALPIMEDAPENQVQSYLRSINKPHLLPCCG